MNVVLKEHIDRLLFVHNKRVGQVDFSFKRFLLSEIDWSIPLIGITGGRGVGKSTMIMQHLKSNYADKSIAIYISLDEYLFEDLRLVNVVESLYEIGYRYFYLDEVHRYANWSKDLKLLHDTFNDIAIVFTGSSILDIYKGESDLSRRAVLYDLPEMSFREYLLFENVIDVESIGLKKILVNHVEIATELSDIFNPITWFKKYLAVGAYPFYKKVKERYSFQLINILNMVIENDLPNLVKMDYKSVHKLRRLMHFISESLPFQPNISKLSSQVEVSRNVLLEFLDYLDKAQIIHALKSPSKSDSHLTKPDKVLLHNTNIMNALSYGQLNIGSAREAFFVSHAKAKHKVNIPKITDFMVDDTHYFEIGGPSKGFNQIAGVPNSYLALDGVKIGNGNKIPLWLFGFLY